MTWNHRVIRTKDPVGDGVSYAIHECFYQKKADTLPYSWTQDPVEVASDTRRGLFWVLSVMAEAVGKPVLEIAGDKLREIEPAQELSDDLRKVLDFGKEVGLGENEVAP
jgi:hypothetical protein